MSEPYRVVESHYGAGWGVRGPEGDQQNYAAGWTADHGEEAVIAIGLTEEHARIIAEALNVNAQVKSGR